MAEKILFLEPGDERAQKIAKAMGSQTASDILQLLADGPISLTDITERLSVPMNTAKYHVENLLEAGLLSVDQTKYSVKGREVKLYALTNQLLIVAPRQSTMRSLILKYASLFGIVVFGTIIIAAFTRIIGPGSMIRGSMNSVNSVAPQFAIQYDSGTAAKAVAENVAQNVTAAPGVIVEGARGIGGTWAGNISEAATSAIPPSPAVQPLFPPLSVEAGTDAVIPWQDPVLMFFLGGLLVIFVLLCYEAWLWKKK
jgi:DNA-binding transcriptional ArsR family regulator